MGNRGIWDKVVEGKSEIWDKVMEAHEMKNHILIAGLLVLLILLFGCVNNGSTGGNADSGAGGGTTDAGAGSSGGSADSGTDGRTADAGDTGIGADSGEGAADDAGTGSTGDAAGQNVVDINVRAFRFNFDPNPITVTKGDLVRLHLTSEDTTHGFSFPEFNINTTIAPGRTTDVEFTADRVGIFEFRCSVVCGSGHSSMTGTLIVNEG